MTDSSRSIEELLALDDNPTTNATTTTTTTTTITKTTSTPKLSALRASD